MVRLTQVEIDNFPSFLGGAFIEALSSREPPARLPDFPSFS